MSYVRTSILLKSLFSTLNLAVNDSPSSNNFISGVLESSFAVSCDYVDVSYLNNS